MRHADKTVTVYRKSWDADAGADVYTGTVLQGVSFFSRIATTVSTEGLAAACEGTLRIPLEVIPKNLDLCSDDLVCEGALPTRGQRPADLGKLCPYVFTILDVTRNTSGRGPHVKVVCK